MGNIFFINKKKAVHQIRKLILNCLVRSLQLMQTSFFFCFSCRLKTLKNCKIQNSEFVVRFGEQLIFCMYKIQGARFDTYATCRCSWDTRMAYWRFWFLTGEPVADERTLFRSSPVFRSPPVYHYGRNFQILSENYAAFFYPLLLKRDSIWQ